MLEMFEYLQSYGWDGHTHCSLFQNTWIGEITANKNVLVVVPVLENTWNMKGKHTSYFI